MAVPARYWRVVLKGNASDSSSNRQRTISRLQLHGEDGTHISEGIVPQASGSVTFYGDPESLVDGDYETLLTWRGNLRNDVTFTFDLSEPTIVDYIEVRAENNDPSYTGTSYLNINNVSIQVFTSNDLLTWSQMVQQPDPILGFGTTYRIPASRQSIYFNESSRKLIGGSGGIYGIVSEDGIARPNRPVYLFERDNFSRVAIAKTDENGGYTFNGLNTQREFTLMSVDISGPPFKNAIVWDRIKPINASINVDSAVSPFWMRRARDPDLGAVFAITGYIDGPAYDFANGGKLGGIPFAALGNRYPGMDFVPSDKTAGGELMFIKSARTNNYIGAGIDAVTESCVFSPAPTSNEPENTQNLTFEYIVKSPQPGEVPLIIVWTNNEFTVMTNNVERMFGAGPTLEITETDLNIRFPLSGRNRGTPKASYPIVSGTEYHVVVAYSESDFIDCYINGLHVGRTSIVGGGPLWGHTISYANTSAGEFNNWDLAAGIRARNKVIDYISCLQVGGTGLGVGGGTPGNSTISRLIPPGFGGAFAMSAVYGRAMNELEVHELYDSYANHESHATSSRLTGYSAFVEADLPSLYFPMSEVSVDDAPASLTGHKGYYALWESLAGMLANGFTSSGASVNTSSGGLIVRNANVVNSVFSVSLFARASSVSGKQNLFSVSTVSTQEVIGLYANNGLINIVVTDPSGTASGFSFNFLMEVGADYNFCVTYDAWDSGVTSLYVNGELFNTVSASAYPALYMEGHSIGIGVLTNTVGNAAGNRFQGDIAEVAIYNYVLSADRISAQYAARDL